MTLQDEITDSIKPGDDFYNFVNRKWSDAHPIPADKSRFGAFTELGETVNAQLHELLEASSGDNEPPTVSLAKHYYRAGMDIDAIERRGLTPLQPALDEITSLTSPADIAALIAQRHHDGRGLLWSLDTDIDEKDSSRYVLTASQAGLLLPDRDYYFETAEQFETTRREYLAFLANVFAAIGFDQPEARAAHVYAIEEKLAAASNTSIENRDIEKLYNPLTFEELETTFAGFDWRTYRETVGLQQHNGIIVHQPRFITTVLTLLESEPLESWRDYLLAHTAAPNLRFLAKRYADLHFNFFGKVLTGAEQEEDRYKRIIKLLTHQLPEPVGRLYVEAHFNESAKEKITELVDHVRLALGERIRHLNWMSDATKEKALEKLATFMPLLGYPDTWRSYDALKLGDNFFENIFAVKKFEWHHDLERSLGPVNRHEWLMSPATVNAYYWPNTNGITFPAAILRPPFFDAEGDFAANYGSIGEVIGHELTHGFDDKGSMYDKIGNLNSWWTSKDRAAFEERSKKLVEQFDAYEIDGQHVKGELTLGENIADLGGILVAYDALQKKLEESGERDAVDGFTPEQRFFMAQARGWRMNIRPELALQFLVTDPHSPAHLRVNGIVTNVDAWYDEWKVAEGDALYQPPSERVRIW